MANPFWCHGECMTCSLTPQQLHDLAADFIGKDWSPLLARFHRAHPRPPRDTSEALELGFVTGLLLGLDELRTHGLTGTTRLRPESERQTATGTL